MRALVVSPGPNFSVYDVYRGWVRGLEANGVDVRTFDLDQFLNLFSGMKRADDDGELIDMFPKEGVPLLAAEHLKSAAFEWWPDIVVVISAFFVPVEVFDLLRARRMKVVLIHTESPYEDDKQLLRAPHVDLNVLNDPVNIDRYPAGTLYVPHAYDPLVHRPGPGIAEFKSDVCFVGTAYPSRWQFIEQVDWSGIDLALGGHWSLTPEDWPLRHCVAHPIDSCLDNDETADAYRSTSMSFNLYRKETSELSDADGWAMGPREVELAACGTFFAREPRAEGDELFPWLPTFTTPDELGEIVRWWLPREEARRDAADKARAAVADRTFEVHARRLLTAAGF